MMFARLLGFGIASLALVSPLQALAKTESNIPSVRVGSLQWDLHEMTIGEVKRFASQTGFVSQAEKNGGGTVYELGFVQKPGWTWKTPFGVNAQDREPAVHLNATEAEQICRFFGKRLPTDEEWVSAAFVEQRANPPAPFISGKRYRFPNGDSAKGSHCLEGECGNYRGLAPKGSLLRGTGHVITGSTEAGVNGLFDMGANAWEWTSTAVGNERVTRGASWWYGSDQQRESNRATKPLDVSVVYIGFRCVKP
jgi:formylglycine-generating enzyme required for sulfatase activity